MFICCLLGFFLSFLILIFYLIIVYCGLFVVVVLRCDKFFSSFYPTGIYIVLICLVILDLVCIFLISVVPFLHFIVILFCNGFSSIYIIYMVFEHLVVSRDRKKHVFADISCAEITDFLVLLDSIISGNISVSSLYYRIDLRNVESCLVKLRNVSPVLARQISDMLNKYDVTGRLKRYFIEMRRNLRRIVFVFLYLIFVVSVAFFAFGGSIISPIVIAITMFGILYVYLILIVYIHLDRTLDDYLKLSEEEKDLLRRCVSDLMEFISEKIVMPIALFLKGEYPHVRITKRYAIIQCRLKHMA